MIYFNAPFNESTFIDTFKGITDPQHMKIFIYEYKLWLTEMNRNKVITAPREEVFNRIVVRSIYFHCGYLKYGILNNDDRKLLTKWTQALEDVITHGIVPHYPDPQQPTPASDRRRLEIITGET